MIVDENGDVSFRQSWLGNAQNCPEQGRLNLLHPTRDHTTSDAFVGTAMHYAVEKLIEGTIGVGELGDAVVECYRTDPEAREIVFTRPKTHQANIAECIDLSTRCAQAWARDIWPKLNFEGARVEVPFDVPVFEYRGRTVSIKGTCDVVPGDGGPLIDHKTSGSSYRQKEKQMHAIQPTVYATADVHGGFGRYDQSWPVEFKYAVVVKLKKECRGEIVTVQRNRGHQEYLFDMMRGWIDLYEATGIDTVSWPKKAEGNFLCSSTWCTHYSECRGKYITPQDDLYGWTPKKR